MTRCGKIGRSYRNHESRTMKILALDTSTDACSAALFWGDGSGPGEIRERFEMAPRAHSRLILPMIESLLLEAGIILGQIDAIAFGRGPGSFTGVRIAAGVTQGIAFGADLPVVPISTLASLAQCAYELGGSEHVLSALDARMGEVYWASYVYDGVYGGQGAMCLRGAEVVCPPAQVPMPESSPWVGVGTAWDRYAQELDDRLGDRVSDRGEYHYPQARYVASLARHEIIRGNTVPAEQALPVYLRDRVANPGTR